MMIYLFISFKSDASYLGNISFHILFNFLHQQFYLLMILFSFGVSFIGKFCFTHFYFLFLFSYLFLLIFFYFLVSFLCLLLFSSRRIYLAYLVDRTRLGAMAAEFDFYIIFSSLVICICTRRVDCSARFPSYSNVSVVFELVSISSLFLNSYLLFSSNFLHLSMMRKSDNFIPHSKSDFR